MKLIYTISYHTNVFINKCNNIISKKYNFFLLYIILIIRLPLLVISLSIKRFRYFSTISRNKWIKRFDSFGKKTRAILKLLLNKKLKLNKQIYKFIKLNKQN